MVILERLSLKLTDHSVSPIVIFIIQDLNWKKMMTTFIRSFFCLLMLLPSLYASTATESKPQESSLEKRLEEHFPSLYSESEESKPESDDFQAKFFRMLFILALLIGFMIVASIALKKMMKTRIGALNQGSQIKVVDSRSLSPRTVIHIIEVEGRRLVVAETASTATLLASLNEPKTSFAEHIKS